MLGKALTGVSPTGEHPLNLIFAHNPLGNYP
jgi:hypothetical protein